MHFIFYGGNSDIMTDNFSGMSFDIDEYQIITVISGYFVWQIVEKNLNHC